MKPTFTIGVFAIIHDDDRRVLLCHRRDHDLWNLPDGALEHGEAPWDGVIREVKEETGLEVEVSGLAGVYSKPEADDLVFSFLCRRVGGEIALSDEADRIEFRFRLCGHAGIRCSDHAFSGTSSQLALAGIQYADAGWNWGSSPRGSLPVASSPRSWRRIGELRATSSGSWRT